VGGRYELRRDLSCRRQCGADVVRLKVRKETNAVAE